MRHLPFTTSKPAVSAREIAHLDVFSKPSTIPVVEGLENLYV